MKREKHSPDWLRKLIDQGEWQKSYNRINKTTMKTIVNIGTNCGNVTKVVFDKPFNDIKYQEIRAVAEDKLKEKGKYEDGMRLTIHGWCDVTK